MALNPAEVSAIAHLARLKIDTNQIPAYTERLTAIIEMMSQLQAVDTQNIEPLAHPLEATQRLRADEVTEINQRDAYQQLAPAVEQGLYLVPRVID
jgi:aspartyl-tRNA(Asn)/glutamyl-tRNA(Gln) amidotransferase subunit C